MNKSRINISRILIVLSLLAVMGINPVIAAESLKSKDAVNKNRGLELRGEIKIDAYSKKISLSLRNTDIRQVLKMLADKAGLNVVVHDSVYGKISLDLVDVKLNKAFEYVMTMNGLSFWKDGNTLIVASKFVSNNISLSNGKMKPINVKYMDANSVASFLNANIFSMNRPDLTTAPIVVTNPRTNQVYVFGSDADIAMAEKTVELLDLKPLIKTFNVNYSNPTKVAGNICNLIFNSNYTNIGKSAGSTPSSNTVVDNGFSLICSQTNDVDTSSTSTSNNGSGSSNTNNNNNNNNNNGMMSGSQSSNSMNQAVSTIGADGKEIPSGAGQFQGLQNQQVNSPLKSLNVSGYAVFANDEVSQVNVMGTEQQIKLAEEMIKKLDKRPLQAYFDISIIEVNETNNKNFNGALSIVNKYVDNLNLNDAGGLTYSKTTRLDTSISSLLATTKGKLLANPKMIVASNTEAKFNVTEKEGGSVSVTATPGTNNNNPVLTYSIGAAVDTGINVTLKPLIKPNGQILLTISPSYITTKPEKLAGNAATNTQVSQTLTAQRDFTLTDVILKDGETFVLGGLINEKEEKTRNKPSLFGAIPFVGGFFGLTQNNKTRSELIFIITPHILKDPDNIPSTEEAI